MVEKLKIESFAQFYVLRKPDGTHAGTVDNLNDAHLYAASEMMLLTLYATKGAVPASDTEIHEKIDAAIIAAQGGGKSNG